tara:strand:+ start:200 stop:835 length:636 start_codon:yes stop_codon:yes gene_type:complete
MRNRKRKRKRKNYHIITLIILFLLQIGFGSNYIKDISFVGKENGVIIEFVFDSPVSPDSVNAWQSNTQWFYFTIYNVLSDTSQLLEQTQVEYPVLTFQPIITEQSTQIGVKLKNSIESFEIFRTNKNNVLKAHLHYSLENFHELSSVSTYKKEKREFSNKFSRSKSWLLLIGSGYTITGLLSDNRQTNTELKIGIGTLVFTYLIHKIWPIK